MKLDFFVACGRDTADELRHHHLVARSQRTRHSDARGGTWQAETVSQLLARLTGCRRGCVYGKT
jgi:hypothetical protein